MSENKPSLADSCSYVEIFVKTPQFYSTLFKWRTLDRSELMLSLSHVYDSCKYQAYNYLWRRRGLYLTGGAKFGGDFLVYPGEPGRYHSQFILVCFDTLAQLDALTLPQLITYARMATSVKKTVVLACLVVRPSDQDRTFLFTVADTGHSHNNRHLMFISINWSHI